MTAIYRCRVVTVVAVVASVGCGRFVDRQAAATTYRVLLKSREAAQRQPDVEIAHDSLAGGLLQLEAFALAYPAHRGFATLYAEAACEYATGFVFDDWEDATLGGRAPDAERAALRLGPLLTGCVDASLAVLPASWRTARAHGAVAWIQTVASATRDEAPALWWIASAGAAELALDPMRHLAEVPAIIAMLARCAELAPVTHDARADVLLGTIDAERSRLLGGDDGNARFERARRLAGDGALIIDVMFAREVAVARRDRPLFEATLRRILASDVARWPDRRLENELALRKARRYLAAESVLLP